MTTRLPGPSLGIVTSDTSGSRTERSPEVLPSDTAPRCTCWPIFSLNHGKATYSSDLKPQYLDTSTLAPSATSSPSCSRSVLEISNLARATTPYGSATRVLALPPYPYQFSQREAKATYADVVKRVAPKSAGCRNKILSSAYSLERIPLIYLQGFIDFASFFFSL